MKAEIEWSPQDATPLGMSLDQLLYRVRCGDDSGLVYDSVSLSELVDGKETIIFDALVTPYANLDRKVRQLQMVMTGAVPDFSVENSQISDPFKQNGSANVVVLFELSDGQTVSVYFHNPDTTPGKILPTDELISWKWLLNKKDITIVVAPERGSDLAIREVGRRIMKLAAKNSAAFKRVNLRRAERLQNISNLRSEVEQLEGELEGLMREIDIAKIEAEDRALLASNKPKPKDGLAALNSVRQFLSRDQFKVIADAMQGEEGEFFIDKALVLAQLIDGMAKTYEQDGAGEQATAYLHYFKGSSDWYITEKDDSIKGTEQAFGLANLGYGGELGYISIDELTRNKAELDLYFEPKPLSAVQGVEAKEVGAEDVFSDSSKPFETYQTEAGGDLFKAANDYFKTELKERMKFVNTAIDKVYLTGSGWKEMKRGMKSDDLKARLTPHIPEILTAGTYRGKSAPHKERSDGYVAFHFFEKVIDLGEVVVTAGINVGEREDGVYEYTAYGLGHSLQEAWAKRKASDYPGNEPGTETFPSSVSATLDSTLGEEGDEINIVILKVIDKTTGQRLTELEDVSLEINQQGHGAGDNTVPATESSPDDELNTAWAELAESFGKDLPGFAGVFQTSDRADTDLASNHSGAWGFVGTLKAGVFTDASGSVQHGPMAETPEQVFKAMTKSPEWQALQASGKAQVLVPEGKPNTVKTSKGTKVETGFSVIEADQLIASHDINGNLNPDYPQIIQPRDRGRDSSIAWVKKTAGQIDPDSLGRTSRADSGAPIVGPDRVVESGNGRTMALQEAYRAGNAEEYRNWLIEEADYFGIDPSRVRAMKAPVLVRVRTSAIDRRTFAVEANQDDKLTMTGTEKAKADADRLNIALLSKLSDDGNLLAASNLDFVNGFLASLGDTEAAQYMTNNGQPTGALIARIQAAIFAKAYDDDRLLELTADTSKPEVANIIEALNISAPDFILAQVADMQGTKALTHGLVESVEASLNQQAIEAIIEATNLVRKARAEGTQVEEAINQRGLFGDIPPATAAMALFINQNNRSSKRLGAAFKAMAQFVRQEAERGQSVDLFGDTASAGLQQVIEAANRQLDKEYGEGAYSIKSLDLFSRTDSPNEPRSIVVTGNELGDFPDTPEGKKALREAAMDMLLKLRGEWLSCPALNGQVEIRKRGINKIRSTSADPLKLKVIPAIREILASAIKIRTRPNYDSENSQNILAYHVLRTNVVIGSEEKGVRIVVSEDDKGLFHYDHTLLAKTAIFDSVESKSPANAGLFWLMGGNLGCACSLRATPGATSLLPSELSNRHQLGQNAILDDAGQAQVKRAEYVVNLFIEGEEPEAVETEDDWDGTTEDDVSLARTETDTNPTEDQKESGDYQKGHLNLFGLDIAIENPQGSIRSGKSKDGTEWSCTMQADYGFIRGTLGADGDEVDVFVGPDLQSDTAFIITQIGKGGEFDEYKTLLGFTSEADARSAYLGSHDSDWDGLSEIRAMNIDEFKSWLDSEAPRKVPDSVAALAKPEQQLETNPTAEPAAVARDLFQAVIDGDVTAVAPDLEDGMLDAGLVKKLQEAYSLVTGDADMEALFERAVDALTAVMLEATEGVQ